MIRDTTTMLWKELAELFNGIRQPSAWMGLLFYLVMFGVFPVLLIGPMFASSPLAFVYWSILPIMIGTGVSLNAFAGERERHTLETLLATRLPDHAIFSGKLAAAVLYSSIYTLLAMLAGLLTLNLAYGNGTLLAYTPAVAAGGIVLGGLVAAVMAAAGVLASLRAASIREAGQKLSFVMMVFFLLYFGMSFVPVELRAAIIQTINAINTWVVVGGISVLLLGIFTVVVSRALQQFQRAQLLLDSPTSPIAPMMTQPARLLNTGHKKLADNMQERKHINLPRANVLTVMWKEWREMRQSENRTTGRRMLIVGIILFGLVLPLQGGRAWVTEGGALFAWIIAPTLLIMQTIADSFAGERERHTLETLLATPLSDRAILLGKLLMPMLWAWGVTQVFIGISAITTTIAFGQGHILFFTLPILLTGMGFGFLVSGLMATTGVLLSLRATSVRQAQQALSIAGFVLALIYVVLIVLAVLIANSIGIDLSQWVKTGTFAPFVWGAAGVLVLMDTMLLTLAMARFRRSRLVCV